MFRRIARIVVLAFACCAGCMAVGMFLTGRIFFQAFPVESTLGFFAISLSWYGAFALGVIVYLWLTPKPESKKAKSGRLALVLSMLLVLLFGAGALQFAFGTFGPDKTAVPSPDPGPVGPGAGTNPGTGDIGLGPGVTGQKEAAPGGRGDHR